MTICASRFITRMHIVFTQWINDISAGYRYIPSMHPPEVGARLPLRLEYKRPCTQKPTPLGVLAGVNSL